MYIDRVSLGKQGRMQIDVSSSGLPVKEYLKSHLLSKQHKKYTHEGINCIIVLLSLDCTILI